MAHSESRRKQDEEYRLREAADSERDRPRHKRAVRDAKLVVAMWNVRVIRCMPITFFPTIWAATAAKRPFLACVCPGCRVMGRIDVRRHRRRFDVSIEVLVPALVCQRCQPNGPHVHILGLQKRWRGLLPAGAAQDEF